MEDSGGNERRFRNRCRGGLLNEVVFDLSTRAKLILGFGSLWFFMGIVIIVAYQAIREINLSAQDLNLVDERIALELLQIRSNQNYIRGQILEMMMTADPVQQSEILQHIVERSQKVDAIIEQLAELNPDPKFQQGVDRVEKYFIGISPRAGRGDLPYPGRQGGGGAKNGTGYIRGEC